jgi:hypothetical protein
LKRVIKLLLAILTLAVATVAQNPIPDQADKATGHNSHSQNKQPNPPVAIPPKPEQGVELQTPSTEERNKTVYENKTETDWWARISNGLIAFGTLALAVIGGIAACIAIRTLRSIERQAGYAKTAAEASEKSAKAAFLNAEAVIHAERPFLVIPMGEEFFQIENPILVSRNSGEYRRSCCAFKIKNFGKSLAKVVEERLALFHGTDESLPPDLTIFDRINPLIEDYPFPPNEIVPNEATFEPDGRITPQELTEITERKRFVWLCGYFRYKDTFDRPDAPEYETRYCYRWFYNMEKTADKKIRVSFWKMAGPREYNRAT